MPTLRWLTRDDDVRAADRVPYRLLEEVPELGHGDSGAGNMLVQGDNLEALKALLPYYAGRVKCIYIDPPYNTGSAFEHYDDNLEHSQWLTGRRSCTACSRASRTNPACAEVLTRQPTILRAKAPMTKAT